MATRQIFTLEAANAILPQLNEVMEKQQALRKEIETLLRELAVLLGDIPEDLSVHPSDGAAVIGVKETLHERVIAYQEGWIQLERLGGVLKDDRLGLVDLYGRVDGNLVWLCWKYGEPEISFYHSLDEGFAGRKAINESTRQRLLN